MKKGDYFLIVGGLLVLVMVSFYFDHQTVQAVEKIRSEFLNEFFLGLTFVSSEIIIFFVITSLFLWREHKRKWILPIWLTLLISTIVGFLLKISVQRLRPFQQGIVSTLPTLASSSFLSWDFSFPSLQAMIVFCAIPILRKEFRKISFVWIIFAILVAFSRVYFGLHFLSDVLVGAILGYVIGAVIVDLETRKRTWSKLYEKIFYGEK